MMSPRQRVLLGYIGHGFKRFREIEVGWNLWGFLPRPSLSNRTGWGAAWRPRPQKLCGYGWTLLSLNRRQ